MTPEPPARLEQHCQPVAVTIADAAGRITMFNEAAEALTGYCRAEVLGRHVSMFYQSEGELQALWADLSSSDCTDACEVTLLGKGQRLIPALITLAVLRDDHGAVVGTVGITVVRGADGPTPETLGTTHAELLNSILCHDIRNYLQVVQGYLDLLTAAPDGDEAAPQRRMLDICRRQILRARDLINRVQTVSKFDNDSTLDVETTSLTAALTEAVDSARDAAADRRPTIHYSPSPTGQVLASPLLLEVFNNLIGNAVLHNPAARPNVWIRVEHGRMDERPCWNVVIEDDGPGVPADALDTQETTVTSRRSGRGVGLELTRQLIRGFGGSLSIQDRPPGEPMSGSRIVVSLLEHFGI